ncbi:hypothetical protein GGS23DRAFT_606331 [Durotheca rogersii]|uniref:uncharacterized protein n=1 Tax=Durotheca rogersii TaxID=419775 RepID=UPI0022207267|nr:uncharacterized protein GGS23DRAFT_606331 [Durotheca rogersii]KAI5861472.1 hypothetical protein GGS23DRAFT_606331 [Durotheca rogersii]
MRLRGSTRQRPVCWTSLPAEIRLMILDAITQQKHPGWASFASVCKEWQSVIERRNFHRLKLRASCLNDFERIIVRPRELVRHICLDIELRKYTCRTCEKSERLGQNSLVFTKGIEKLFRILSTWKLANGLTLELNAYSPSDSDHWFKNYYFTSSNDGNGDATSTHFTQETNRKWHNPEHDWANGRQHTTPPSFVKRHLPQTLKRISAFEDFSEDIVAALGGAVPASSWSWSFLSHTAPGAILVSASRVVEPQLGAAFAARSLDLEQLSVSYMVNARDFFQACTPTWTWERLDRKEIDALLFNAGITALRMPKLQTLVLWNGHTENACAFIHHTGKDHASVAWRGTWNMDLSPRVVELWRRVAFEGHSRHALRVDKQRARGVIESHGDAIYHLNFPCQVVSPVSLWQIRKEATDRSA